MLMSKNVNNDVSKDSLIGLTFKRGSQRAIRKLTLEQGRHHKTQIRFHV